MERITRRDFLEESALAGAGAAAATEAFNLLAAAEPDAGAKAQPLRLCRYQDDRATKIAFYHDDHLVDLHQLAKAVQVQPLASLDLLDYLPPAGKAAGLASDLAERYRKLPEEGQARLRTAAGSVKLLVPIPEPRKIIL